MLVVCYPRESCEEGQEKGAQYQRQLEGRAMIEDTHTSYVELCVCVCVCVCVSERLGMSMTLCVYTYVCIILCVYVCHRQPKVVLQSK